MVAYKEEAPELFSIELFSGRTCDSIVKTLARRRSWHEAKVRKQLTSGHMRSMRMASVRIARVLDPERAADIYDAFDRQIDRKVKPLITKVWGAALREHAGSQIIRYGPNGYYHPHTDSGLDFEDRYFTILCYLNDNFEGGSTFFPYLNYHATPRRGRAIIFPSRYMHAAEPVLRGEKFVALSWVMGPLPIQWL
jgi:predicted 2-oxoglutarate/Fe(II)-dependent dioxygenase YbiX